MKKLTKKIGGLTAAAALTMAPSMAFAETSKSIGERALDIIEEERADSICPGGITMEARPDKNGNFQFKGAIICHGPNGEPIPNAAPLIGSLQLKITELLNGAYNCTKGRDFIMQEGFTVSSSSGLCGENDALPETIEREFKTTWEAEYHRALTLGITPPPRPRDASLDEQHAAQPDTRISSDLIG